MEKEPEVFRLTNADYANLSTVRNFLLEVFPEDSYVLPGGYEARPDLFNEIVLMQDVAILLGAEDDRLQGLAIVYTPEPSGLFRAQILHFHNTGSTALRQKLVSAAVDFVKEHGHIEVWAINATERPASVWGRMFKRWGEPTKVGDIMRVELK